MLWAFWFAAGGLPHIPTLLIFLAGTVLTRSAGCAINDYADRNFDGHVTRTKDRPLPSGALSAKEALAITALLMGIAFGLVLLTSALTIKLSFIALFLALLYPFTKRYTHFPQVFLGAAFAMAVPMAFAAQTNSVPAIAWQLFAAAVIWATAYDTLLAMADRPDDIHIGVKSTAIFFGRADLIIVFILQALTLSLLMFIGWQQGRGIIFHVGLVCAAVFVIHQLRISRHREPSQCLRAFLNNHFLGMCIFIALAVDFAIKP